MNELVTHSILKTELDVRFSAINQKFEDLKSYVGVLMEENRHRQDLILEGFGSQQINIENYEKRLIRLETEIPILKMAIAHRK